MMGRTIDDFQYHSISPYRTLGWAYRCPKRFTVKFEYVDEQKAFKSYPAGHIVSQIGFFKKTSTIWVKPP